MCDWIRNRNETCLDLPSRACWQRTFLSPAGANYRNWNVKPALYAVTATKTMQAATVNKSLQFCRRLRRFFAPVWGLPLVAVYVQSMKKLAVKALLSLRIFCAGLGSLNSGKPFLIPFTSAKIFSCKCWTLKEHLSNWNWSIISAVWEVLLNLKLVLEHCCDLFFNECWLMSKNIGY